MIFEPVRPAKIRCLPDQNHIAKNAKVSACRQRRFWLDCADAQADLSLFWALTSEGSFPRVADHFTFTTRNNTKHFG